MNGNPPSRELAICLQRADPGTALKKRVRVYRPPSRAGVFGNLLLIVVTLAVALFLGTDQLPFSAVVVSLGIAIVLAGALAFIGSGWAMAGLVVLLFAGPIATRFVLVGAQLSIRAWFTGLIAGWTCGALLRRFADRGLTGRGLRESAVLRWWIRSKRFEQSAPTIAQLAAKITSLDGRDRSLVVLRDGLRQLEVCGDANGRMIVFLSEDVGDPSRWEVPKSGVVDPRTRWRSPWGTSVRRSHRASPSRPMRRWLLRERSSLGNVCRVTQAYSAARTSSWCGQNWVIRERRDAIRLRMTRGSVRSVGRSADGAPMS